ncbi:E3 ubiquitin-protein ligase At1g63170-like [Impatiens glandulifera]|uniref:E3 ubiquitin-protein ligase At1g63170-like n=1 Tax=Impatiens glandulifera TaxID=253017 RepID=UPI001FB1946E|nr:E3 ubiquitin-protein ligase At1g63170-like [Impatiens glandulifera]
MIIHCNRTTVSLPSPDDRRRSLGRNLAVRISRARWYSFLRRVFHYQNGSRSDLGSNPFDSGSWMVMELLGMIVQLVVIVNTLFVSKDERPVWPMRIWLAGYGGGCGFSLIVLYFRYRILYRAVLSDEEQQRLAGEEEPRSMRLMINCRTCLDLFFAIWFVMGNIWVFDARVGSFRRAPKLHVLCISLLTWNAINYSFPFVLFVFLCCCVPLISTIVGYNMNTGSLVRGASEDQISKLMKWTFNNNKRFVDLEHGKSNLDNDHQIAECCICLAKYNDNEEIRQLPCSHIFHLKCVDQWLRITSSCPLCKQELDYK